MLLSSALHPHRELHYRRGARCSIDDKYNKHRAVLMIMPRSLRVLRRRIEASEHYSQARQKLRRASRANGFVVVTTRRGCKSRPTTTAGKASGAKLHTVRVINEISTG